MAEAAEPAEEKAGSVHEHPARAVRRAGVIKCRQTAACRMPGRHALRCGFISSQDLTPVPPRGVPLCQPLAPEICIAVRRLRPHAATRHAAWRANFRGLDSTGDVLAEISRHGVTETRAARPVSQETGWAAMTARERSDMAWHGIS